MQQMMELKRKMMVQQGVKERSRTDAHNSSSTERSELVGTRSRTPTFAEQYAVNNNVYRDYQPVPMNSYIEEERSAVQDISARYQIPSITAQSSSPFQPQPAQFRTT